jgi:molybdopterin/thiamine biosynthesis adenylyltransferase
VTELETFDHASLEAFTSELVAAGYEPEPGSERKLWKGPIHPAFDGLTEATRMRMALRDGWPFVFPVLFVDGLHTNHLTEHGYVCLWHDGDGSGQWQTVDGFFERIEEWCEQAKTGWDVRGLARDAYLNFTRKHPAVATFDFRAFHADNVGSWGSFHGTVRHPFHVELHPGAGGTTDLDGLWFHVGTIEVPPRNLTELRATLNAAQRRGLDRALKRRRDVDVLQRSSSVDLVMFCWDRDETRHVLVLALSRTGHDVEAQALTEGPNDEQSLLLRAGPDVAALRTKSVSIFGLGALGGHTAVCLASSGVGRLRLVDPELILPGNVVRHVAGHNTVGIPKVHAVQANIAEHAPWTQVDPVLERPQTPSRLLELIDDADLVLDATGSEAATGSLAAVAAAAGKPLVSGGLFRGGAIARVQRQGTPGDIAIADRLGDDRYRMIHPGDQEEELVEPAVGCSAPVNNAPPSSVLACAALLAQSALDVLSGRCALPDEITDVHRTLDGEPPFDQLGRVR